MLGKEWKAFRKQNGYLQKDAAKRIGISCVLLSKIEREIRDPTEEEIRKIFAAFPEFEALRQKSKQVSKHKKRYTVYTDGGCLINPGGPGGIGALIVDETGCILSEISKGYYATTNNRMEIMAVIEALMALPEDSEITLFSDSQYLVRTMEAGWSRNKNKDLWKRLDIASYGKKITYRWVRGHNGNLYNEKCDELATMGMNSQNKNEDPGFQQKRKETGNTNPSFLKGGAMSVPIQCKDHVYTETPLFQLHKTCRVSIGRFQKSRKTFKDYMNVKTGGRDGWSAYSCQQLKNLFGEKIYRIAFQYLPDSTSVGACLRWYGRGLSLKDSIRKVLVDLEISTNCGNRNKV